MVDFATACLVFTLLCGSAAVGRWLFKVLPETHRTRETMEFVRLASGLLVTFTALVLSLLITTVHADFRKTDTDLRTYASMIVILDSELDSLGASTLPTRSLLRRYTASAVASTWPDETPPAGNYPEASSDGSEIDAPVLGEMLHLAENQIRQLAPKTGEAEKAQSACLIRISALLDQRWSLISEAHSTITPPFFFMMLFWLATVFAGFGMTAPQNVVSAFVIAMIGVSVACAIFVVLEFDGPLDGLIKVSSEPMRHALRHLEHAPST